MGELKILQAFVEETPAAQTSEITVIDNIYYIPLVRSRAPNMMPMPVSGLHLIQICIFGMSLLTKLSDTH